jgi:hypothetical protein
MLLGLRNRGGTEPKFRLAVNKNKARARSSLNYQSSVELFSKLKVINYINVNSHTFVFDFQYLFQLEDNGTLHLKSP